MSAMLAAVITLGVAVVLLGILVLGLLRSHALILKALHDLGAGLELEKEAGGTAAASGHREAVGPVPVTLESGVVANARPETVRAGDITGLDLDGAEVNVPLAGRRTLLAFLTSGCSVCMTFWETFASSVAVPGDADLVIVAKGDAEESRVMLRRLAGERPVVMSSAAWSDFEIPGSPYFVYVEDGLITGEGSATTWEQVSDLMAQAVSEVAEARAARTEVRVTSDDVVNLNVLGASRQFEGRGELDTPSRIDSELLAAGVRPGDASLYVSPDPADGARPAESA